MFVLAKRNILFKAGEGQSFKLQAGLMSNVPDWVAKSQYFAALVKDGKIIVPETHKDRDIEKAAVKADAAEKKAKETYKKKVEKD